MELKTRLFPVESDFTWEGVHTIECLKSELDRLEKLGATEIHIDTYVSYDTAYLEVDIYESRQETEDEYKERIKKQQDRIDRIKQIDLDTYKKLLEKYPELKK